MSRVELENFRDFLEKFAEICSVTVYNMKEGRDPTDEGWDILEEVHRIFLDGSVVLYKTVMDGADGTAVQAGLFSDETSDKR